MKPKVNTIFQETQSGYRATIVHVPVRFDHDIYILSISDYSKGYSTYQPDIILKATQEPGAIREGIKLWDEFLTERYAEEYTENLESEND